ncbi:MAG TPA: DUF423 domain-containing protein [Pseudoxanthomonas sp.]
MPNSDEAAVLLTYDRRQRKPSVPAFAGALLAAAAIALSAYAAHGVSDAHAQSNLQTAAMYAFGHGVALAALGAGTTRSLGRAGLFLLLLGTLLFSGSLALNVLAQVGSKLAPVGGICLILGWTSWALDALRR